MWLWYRHSRLQCQCLSGINVAMRKEMRVEQEDKAVKVAKLVLFICSTCHLYMTLNQVSTFTFPVGFVVSDWRPSLCWSLIFSLHKLILHSRIKTQLREDVWNHKCTWPWVMTRTLRWILELDSERWVTWLSPHCARRLFLADYMKDTVGLMAGIKLNKLIIWGIPVELHWWGDCTKKSLFFNLLVI